MREGVSHATARVNPTPRAGHGADGLTDSVSHKSPAPCPGGRADEGTRPPPGRCLL